MIYFLAFIAAVAAVGLGAAFLFTLQKLKSEKRELESNRMDQRVLSQRSKGLEAELREARSKMAPADQIEAAASEAARLRKEAERKISEIDNVIQQRKAELLALDRQVKISSEDKAIAELGFIRRNFTYEDPAAYQRAIGDVEDKLAEFLKSGKAAICTINWTIEGSGKKGDQMIGKLLKLATRTFNADADSAISRVKWNNYEAMVGRIHKSEDAIEKTLEKWGVKINDDYRKLKLAELHLTFEQAEVIQRSREEQRDIREQQREEDKARREAELAQREAEREERRVGTALEKAKKELAESHSADMTKHLERIRALEEQLATAAESRQRAVSMAELTKRGHVYIASNLGSFGPGVLKIGMTRRLDPMDRIWELSDASVPFDFDVHGMISTDDAPALEAKLHKSFDDRRLNLVNQRKEFFRVTIQEIQGLVIEYGLDVKLTLAAEAKELYESEALRTQGKAVGMS